MKKKLLFLPLFGLAMMSCQTDIEPEMVKSGDGNVNFHISAPEAMEYTRGGNTPNSALGGISNVDWSNYDLRYQLAVYQVNDDNTTRLVIPAQTVSVDNYSEVDYSLRLTPNRTYTFVVWADFVTQGSQADLHYDTADMENISCLDANDAMLNDESRDAFFVTETVTVGEDGLDKELVLRRPFAKLRVIATDWGIGDLDLPDAFDVTYYGCNRFEGLNARTGETVTTTALADDCSVSYHATIDKDNKEYTLGYDSSDRNRTLIVDYLVAQPSQTSIHLTLAPNGNLPVRDFSTDVPIRRNWLTTILGDLLTTGANIHILCDEAFIDEYNGFDSTGSFTPVAPYVDKAGVYHIKTANELAWISENVASLTQATVVLDNDIDLMGINWKPINTSNNINYFNGQGHTIYNLSVLGDKNADFPYSGNSYAGLFGVATFINISNLSLENVSINNHSSYAGAIVGCLHPGGPDDFQNELRNCSVKNVFIRPIFYDEDRTYSSQDAGGLVGICNGGNFYNCHAEHINVMGSVKVAGIAGYVNANNVNYDINYVFEDCTVKDATLWELWVHDNGSDYDNFQLCQIGSITSFIDSYSPHRNRVDFNNCDQSDVTYVIGGHCASSNYGWVDSNEFSYDPHNINGLYILHTGDEKPWDEAPTMTLDDGRVLKYGPLHKFFGIADNPKILVYVNGVADPSGDY
ncbi:MAG: hypothetical protein KIG61_04975 [Muribaculaceae bacterium]|nr:hypothetical protein [Muribaculaceae bacterium]